MAVDEKRWGILYCPKGRSSKQREKIQRVLDDRQVQYDFVQSESTDSVERLVSMLIHNGYKTIIVAGGDSALNDAVNCLMKEEKQVRDSIALGVIPNGVMNDFARYWDFKEGNIEQTVDWLIQHRVRQVDLGCIRYTNQKGESCHRYFLNCVNIGLIADVMNMRRQARSLLGSRTLSFIVSLFLMIFHRMDYKMNVKINSDVVNRKIMTMCVGSGPGYGQTPNAVPYNGLLDVSVVYHTGILQVFAGVWLLITGRFLNHHSVHPYRSREVKVEEAKHAFVSIDGRLMNTPVGAYQINVEQEVINFLIPV
ncbi:MAG: lipid kinase [Prevotella sp.]|nr:lipid kinase [Prevotella sp.]MBQ8152883.1 lipid kinase [Prevotella sp.]